MFSNCFSPDYPVGVTCGPGGWCPPGQRCELTSNACQIIGSEIPDAAPQGEADTLPIVDGASVDSSVMDPELCQPGCVGDSIQVCGPDPMLEQCPLGCNDAIGACRQLVPSNGATREQLAQVSGTMLVTEEDAVTVNTDTGAILRGTETVRGPGEGVISGFGFFSVDDKVAVLSMKTLTMRDESTMRLVGTRGMILLSEDTVSIRGLIDVSAGCSDGDPRCGGPGGGDGAVEQADQAAGCAPGQGGSGGGTVDETGGGGGGLGQDGAPGGNTPSAPGGAGGIVGAACPGPSLVPLRGGSGGGAGGEKNRGGSGGGGGGAIQITSFTSIVLHSVEASPAGIHAGGGGGGGGESPGDNGGGGGGSGGAILLEAPVIEIANQSVLAANGGGGGGGGTGGENIRGESGVLDDRQAQGGGLGSHRGGDGGALNEAATSGSNDAGDDTGGGGGGVGIIRLNVPEAGLKIDQAAIISPVHTRGELLIE